MNIPNILTVFRLCLIPVYIAVFATEGSTKELSAIIFIAASVTDVLDGYIARKYNMTTWVGQLLDPLADKLMQLTVVISLMIAKILPIWFVAILAVKECLMIAGGIFLYSKKTYVKSNILGKMNTVILFLAMVIILFAHTNDLTKLIVLSISAAFNLITIASYLYIYFIKKDAATSVTSQNNDGGLSK